MKISYIERLSYGNNFLYIENSSLKKDSIFDKEKYVTYKLFDEIKEKNIISTFLIHQKEDWKEILSEQDKINCCTIERKINAHINANRNIKFHSMSSIPENMLFNFLLFKEKSSELTMENYTIPSCYETLLRNNQIIDIIKSNKINLDRNILKENDLSYKKEIIDYDIFGTVTGRVSTKEGTIPFLSLKKELRAIFLPAKKYFVSFDFNGAELRTLYALLGKNQPKEDIISTLSKYFPNKERNEIKKEIYHFIYSNGSTKTLSKEINFEFLYNKYYNDVFVETPYKRQIASDQFHAINYLVQSTLNDLVFEQIYKVYKKYNIKIFASLHDEFIFEADSLDFLCDIKKTFSETRFGEFPVKIKIGDKNLFDMKEYII